MTIKRRHFLSSIGGITGLGAVPALSGCALAAAATVPSAQGKATPLYKNPRASMVARLDDLMARMTLDEKIMQLQCVWQQKHLIQDASTAFSADKASRRYPNGLGMIGRPSDRQKGDGGAAGDSGLLVNRNALETANYVNAAQKWSIEETRLGIPLLMHEEALHGYVAVDATSFPQAIGLASSFDPALVTEVFSVAAREMRARGANLALAPVVDVAREPRWGRIEETYGEDPMLCGEMGKAAVRGFMGDTLPLTPTKVLATLKHLTGHGQPENGTNIGPAAVGERMLREDFFPPFEKIIRETNISAVMPSYNEIDGVPSHGNHWMLTTVMRGEWGFKGAAVSDYFAVKELITRHHLVAAPADAALRAIKAGVDIETPDVQGFDTLAASVKDKRLTVAEIDVAVRRVLKMKFDAGLFEAPYVDVSLADSLTATPDAIALARRAAVRSAVLLKNANGTLPLDAKKIGRVLLLGTHAKDCPIGGYSSTPRHVVSVLEGLQAESKAQGFPLAYSEGVRITEEHTWGQSKINFTPPEVNARLITEALEAAKSADTIVMVLGDNEQTSREAWADNHLGDRETLDLIGQQNDLAKAIFELGKTTIVLLLNGRPMSVNLLAERADALLEGWYLGQQTGNAVADLLFGRANPGGKLPVSVARSVGQLPIFYNNKPSARRGYIDGSTKPLYPFGFGLSYTSFAVGAPRLTRARMGVGDATEVLVDVTNTGKVCGDEVVQIYVRDDVSSVTRPVLELKRFERITLEPGETRSLRFAIKPSDLWFYNTEMKRVVEPGTFTIFAGASSVDLKPVTLTVA
ncbi:MAG: glycoside hydrolase family 3 N-terminal domain-containing protein [Burkholderiales bacterium]